MKITSLVTCEKVIRDAETSGLNPSLVTLFMEIQANVQEGTDLPGDAVAQKPWAIFTLWQVDEQEIGFDYAQRVEVLWPDGSLMTRTSIPFKVEKGDWVTNVSRFETFPIGQVGKIKIAVWIERDGNRVTDISETWIGIKHNLIKKPVPANA